ncbi:rhodanese-like domain-containing protein [Flavobacterium sp. MFBS3-15]|uniref:rhodanese-like domain-containing protein n=1 Tax=Flavobacterium sp. MFBS3-15 TaxID=2989816 RepID=UPI0022357DEB|nr:rhodanese-like domain-containing protein [Flavobacterium sp. MFBS3-15]MCW4468897.1 rhodanese-like domain-containing protein [Flavobacterium sp. MFBS3-15]
MKNITQQEWEEKVAADKNAVILDVRTEQECMQGMLANAQCLDIFARDRFVAGLEKMDKSKSYYVYCRSGQRSASACQVMDQMGFANTYSLIGGISAWKGEIVK